MQVFFFFSEKSFPTVLIWSYPSAVLWCQFVSLSTIPSSSRRHPTTRPRQQPKSCALAYWREVSKFQRRASRTRQILPCFEWPRLREARTCTGSEQVRPSSSLAFTKSHEEIASQLSPIGICNWHRMGSYWIIRVRNHERRWRLACLHTYTGLVLISHPRICCRFSHASGIWIHWRFPADVSYHFHGNTEAYCVITYGSFLWCIIYTL